MKDKTRLYHFKKMNNTRYQEWRAKQRFWLMMETFRPPRGLKLVRNVNGNWRCFKLVIWAVRGCHWTGSGNRGQKICTAFFIGGSPSHWSFQHVRVWGACWGKYDKVIKKSQAEQRTESVRLLEENDLSENSFLLRWCHVTTWWSLPDTKTGRNCKWNGSSQILLKTWCSTGILVNQIGWGKFNRQ